MQIPDEAFQLLAQGQNWEGNVKLSASLPTKPEKSEKPNKRNRTNTIKDASKKATKSLKKIKHLDNKPEPVKVSDKEWDIVDAWNDSTYIKNHIEESRNNEIVENQAEDNIKVIRQALKIITESIIYDKMYIYFKTCKKGEHIWDGRNHGYANLIGFLNALLRAEKSGKKLWWDDEKPIPLDDDNPELTTEIADSFALYFLGRKRFYLKNPSKEYECFRTAASWIKKIVKSGIPIEENELIKMIMDCVKINKSGGKAVTPYNVSSSMLWSVWWPQYLKKFL